MSHVQRPESAGAETAPAEAAAVSAGPGTALNPPSGSRLPRFGRWGTLALFLAPAAVFLLAIVVYPTVYTFIRSLYSNYGNHFVGLGNYKDMFSESETLTAIKNNAIWVAVAPTVVTALGLMFAVLTERIRWATAFKFILFMPMAIGFLASGIIFRLVYQQDPSQGIANAMTVSIHDTFFASSQYPGANAVSGQGVTIAKSGALTLDSAVKAGQPAKVPVLGIPPDKIPSSAATAAQPPNPSATQITGTVWLDFTPGGTGTSGQIDASEKGLPGMKVEAVSGGNSVASATTSDNGTFTLSGLKPGQTYGIELPASNFAKPYRGIAWLGPTLVTWSIIAAYVWMWAGFAMVLIAAGLAAIPRDALEAARVDGATEWQVFRRVTVPLLSPVLLVVFVTLVINVLKIFDLVFIISPGNVQADDNVLAVEMWRKAFGGQPLQGLGSAIAIFLFVLVVPAMLFNLRRFRQDQR